MKVSLWKCIKCFLSTLCRRNLKTQQSLVILDLYLRKTRSGISHDYRDVIIIEKLRFQNVFHPRVLPKIWSRGRITLSRWRTMPIKRRGVVLCVHSLEIKELILIIFERKQLTFVCVISSSFQFVPGTEQRLLGFSFHFQRKMWPLTLAVKYFSAAVMAQCPRHVFDGNSHGPNDSRFLLSYSYKSSIFQSLCICWEEN